MSESELNAMKNIDILGRLDFAKRLTTAIDTDFKIQDESYVLLLTGSYGSGKTTFLEMWDKYLTGQEYKVIRINSWETGFEESPIVPILYELSKLIPESETQKKIKLAMPYLTLTASIFVNMVTGIDPVSAAEQLDKLKGKLDKISSSIFEAFESRYNAINTLKDVLKQICSTLNEKPLYIFIDELDRLQPDYAIAYLEVIKHFFSVRGVVFVIACDKEQLYNGIKHHLGFHDTAGYLLRFITREACIPNCSLDDRFNFINDTLDMNFSRRSIANMPNRVDIVKHLAFVSDVFDLTLRETQMVLRCLTQYITTDPKENRRMNFGGMLVTFFMLCLYQKDHEKYVLFGTDNATVKLVWSYLESKFKFDNEPIINNVVASILLGLTSRRNHESVYNLPVNDNVLNMLQEPWHLYHPGFDFKPRNSIFQELFVRLQGWFSFFEQMPR